MIRQYKSADLEAVKRLHFEGLKQFNAYIGNPNLDKDMETIEETYIHNGGDFLVGLVDNKIIAIGAFRKYDEQTAEIKRIRVDNQLPAQKLFERNGYKEYKRRQLKGLELIFYSKDLWS